MSAGEKAHYYEMIANVRSKRDRLPSESLLRAAVSDEMLDSLLERIRNTDVNQLDYGKWPPAFGFIDTVAAPTILDLDASIRSVLAQTRQEKRPAVAQFLKAPEGDARQWYGGLFDLAVKATLVSKGVITELDHRLPNGRDHDARIEIEGRPFHVEGTVLTEDDESAAIWEKYIDDKRLDRNKVLIRPGPYCPPDAKGPSPYYDVLRVYGKVFDKLTKRLDPSRGQFAADSPNVLLISFAGAGVRASSPAVGWALDELMVQRRTARTIVPEGFTDISLDAWLDFTADQLIQKRRMTVEWYCENSNRVLDAVHALSAICVYDGCSLVQCRINYNANDAQRITHREMAQLEDLCTLNAGYWL